MYDRRGYRTASHEKAELKNGSVIAAEHLVKDLP
jgi:hypothetical protein